MPFSASSSPASGRWSGDRRRRALAVGVLCVGAAWPAAAQDNRGSLTFVIENDSLAGTDRHYTNGFNLSWVSAANDVPGWANSVATAIPLLAPDGARRIGYAFGQSMFAPKNIERSDLILNDRPYAGWLYGAVTLSSDTGTRLDSIELDVGVVGPWSQAEHIQRAVHDLIGSTEPRGWDNQLRNELGINLVYERKYRGLAELGFGALGADVIPSVTVSLGNVFTYAAAGALLRFGRDLPNDYGPPRVRPGLAGSSFFSPRESFGWYLFAGAEGRAVAHDITLDGNTFKDSHSVDKEHFVGDLQAGLALHFSAVRVTFSYVYRTREFREQEDPNQFAAVGVSLRF